MARKRKYLHLFRPWWSTRLWLRLAVGFGTLVVLMLVVVVLAIVQFRALSERGEQMMSHDLQRLLQAREIRQHADSQGSAMVRLFTAPRDERETIYPLMDAEHADIERLVGTLSGPGSDARSRAILQQVARHQQQYRETFAEVVTWIESDELATARAMFHAAAQPALSALVAATGALFDHEQAVLRERQRESEQGVQRAQWSLAALAFGAMLLAVALAWRTTRSVASPLARVEQAARRIAEGDYAARVAVRGGDELSRVAQAMNAMAGAVAAREAEIERLAYDDPLTGLPNRNGLRHIAAGFGARPMAMLLMDVARLRTVNEVLGFHTGDAMLVQIAERLRKVFADDAAARAARVLGRLGGGVFVLMGPDIDGAELERLMERINHQMSEAMVCDGHEVDAQFVYGLALSRGAEPVAFDTLLQHAELAVGDAKQAKQAWAWHAPVDPQARAGQLSLLSNLRSAAAAGELEMWLQPKQCLRTGRILGMEALVRWRHPQRGFVSPAEFIPFAERTGHIGVVTRAMVHAALQALAAWQHDRPALTIAVNVSALEIRDATFAGRIAQMAQQAGAPLHRLRLEITESSLMEDADGAMPALTALRALGLQLSIDDFGTGYSSLSYLKKLPVDELKIDRSFVAHADGHEDAQALLRAIVELGHNLNMVVTAEGIERDAELQLLAAMGCDQAQGYLISRPLDPAAARAYVAALPQ